MVVRKGNGPVAYDSRTNQIKLEDTIESIIKLISSRGGDLLTEDGYVASVDIDCLLEVQGELEALLNLRVEEYENNCGKLQYLIKNLNVEVF